MARLIFVVAHSWADRLFNPKNIFNLCVNKRELSHLMRRNGNVFNCPYRLALQACLCFSFSLKALVFSRLLASMASYLARFCLSPSQLNRPPSSS